MNNIDKIFDNSNNASEYSKSYLDYLNEVLSGISVSEIEDFVEVLLEARERGSNIFFIGNGGSAATASHFANDIAIGSREFDKPFRVISLCDNQAVITAIANDDGFEQIFSQQLRVLLKEQDVVVSISASGNSSNLIHAINTAKTKIVKRNTKGSLANSFVVIANVVASSASVAAFTETLCISSASFTALPARVLESIDSVPFIVIRYHILFTNLSFI